MKSLKLGCKLKSPGELYRHCCFNSTFRDSNEIGLEHGVGIRTFENFPSDFNVQPKFRTTEFLVSCESASLWGIKDEDLTSGVVLWGKEQLNVIFSRLKFTYHYPPEFTGGLPFPICTAWLSSQQPRQVGGGGMITQNKITRYFRSTPISKWR